MSEKLAAYISLHSAAQDLFDALTTIGAMPEGYCFCFNQPNSDQLVIGKSSRDATRPDHLHTGECRAARAAIKKATLKENE